MKKIILAITAFICIFAFVGCVPENAVNIKFPFSVEDIAFIEIQHSSISGYYSESKVLKSKEDIEALYNKFESLSYTLKDTNEGDLRERTSFTFKLSDGREYELIYLSYGVKNGRLYSSGGEFNYFTSSDIQGLWRWLAEDSSAVPVD